MLQIYSISKKIEEIVNILPFSNTEKNEIKEFALQLSKKYINQLNENEERFPSDVVLSSIYISIKKTGIYYSHSEISKMTGYSLSSWPRIVVDMDKKVNGNQIAL